MREVTVYPKDIKAAILAKVMAPNAPGVVELSTAHLIDPHRRGVN